ncbi:MAG: metal ABC transporter substrate-binding protein [Candidatus Latescibacterota bacterium]
MRKNFPVLLSAILLSACLSISGCGKQSPSHSDKLRVVTSITVLEDFVRAVGGDQVSVTSLITGLENPHTYEPKVSAVRAVAEADLFVKVGLGIEEWAEKLVANAGNEKLVALTATEGIAVLERGINGGGGNPHVWMDPRNAGVMVGHIRDALCKLRPESSKTFESRTEAYLAEMDSLRIEIGSRFPSLVGRKVVTYAPAFPYLLQWLGVSEAERIMTVPGMEPSARRISEVIDRMRTEQIGVILTMPQYSGKVPEMIAAETGARIVRITPLLGALPGTATYLAMLRTNAEHIALALQAKSCR